MLHRRGRKVSNDWDAPAHVDDDMPPAEDGVVVVEMEPWAIRSRSWSHPWRDARGAGKSGLGKEALLELESVAVELARLAAAEIQTALGRELAIRYKGAEDRQGASRFRDPATEADERIEQLVRDRLAERFPEHGVVGERWRRSQATPKHRSGSSTRSTAQRTSSTACRCSHPRSG
jgi:hypothetical protein